MNPPATRFGTAGRSKEQNFVQLTNRSMVFFGQMGKLGKVDAKEGTTFDSIANERI